jgi:hypothetical protein
LQALCGENVVSGIQCSDCGRFLGEADFALGLCDYTPESEFGHERIEWTCRRHAQGTEAGTATTENTGVVHDGPVSEGNAPTLNQDNTHD